jgi:hypothetical protein
MAEEQWGHKIEFKMGNWQQIELLAVFFYIKNWLLTANGRSQMFRLAERQISGLLADFDAPKPTFLAVFLSCRNSTLPFWTNLLVLFSFLNSKTIHFSLQIRDGSWFLFRCKICGLLSSIVNKYDIEVVMQIHILVFSIKLVKIHKKNKP